MLNPLLQKLAVYNNWANSKLIEYLKHLGNYTPTETLKLFSHVLNAQIIWLNRIQSVSSSVTVWQEHTLAEIQEFFDNTSKQLEKLAGLEPDKLEEIIHYTNTKGEPFATSIQDILTHVFNHGTYHRAQIARDLRQNGFTPLNTDYIIFVREQANRS